MSDCAGADAGALATAVWSMRRLAISWVSVARICFGIMPLAAALVQQPTGMALRRNMGRMPAAVLSGPPFSNPDAATKVAVVSRA